MQNAAVISRIWQCDTQEGQVHGHGVPLRSKELGKPEGDSGCSNPG